jgi:hypothetical protein
MTHESHESCVSLYIQYHLHDVNTRHASVTPIGLLHSVRVSRILTKVLPKAGSIEETEKNEGKRRKEKSDLCVSGYTESFVSVDLIPMSMLVGMVCIGSYRQRAKLEDTSQPAHRFWPRPLLGPVWRSTSGTQPLAQMPDDQRPPTALRERMFPLHRTSCGPTLASARGSSSAVALLEATGIAGTCFTGTR